MIDFDKLIKEAMIAKDKDSLRTYRNIKTRIMEFKTAENAKEYTAEAELNLLKDMVKKLDKSVDMYTHNNREDLAKEYKTESDIIKKLLPAPANPQMLKLGLISISGVEFSPETGDIKIPKKMMGMIIKNMQNQFPDNNSAEIAKLVKEYVV